MLDSVGGDIPEAQWQLQNSKEYLAEGTASCLRPHHVPAAGLHLEYLRSFIVDAGSTDYADQATSNVLQYYHMA